MALYGIVVGDGTKRGTFAFRRTKAEALAVAKSANGRVYVMKKEPSSGVWDAPTFIMSAEFVTSFEKKVSPGKRRRFATRPLGRSR